MIQNIALLKLKDAWRECERNIYYLSRALILLDMVMPITGDVYENLTDDQVQIVDQFIG